MAQHDAAPVRTNGLRIDRVFSKEGVDPYDEVKWVERTAEIKDAATGEVVFRQEGCLFPESWSQLAVDVVASKFFRGDKDKGSDPKKGGRESSVKQLVGRVAGTIANWGFEDGYFATGADYSRFHHELAALCLNQYASFNSPVWFNVGLGSVYGLKGPRNNWRWDKDKGESVPCEDALQWPQCSACFLQGVEDDMDGIMELAASEARLFKFGSGTGTNLSTLRSSKEKLSGGGRPSGPISFMRVYDAVAGVVKSGGTTRRAAKMQVLNDDHPDIMAFVECKKLEEDKARALIRQGYPSDYNGSAYGSVCYQNANLSVWASEEFMKAAESGGKWHTKAVMTGEPVEELDASAMLDRIAECAWECGDPALQFSTTINSWHTIPNSGRINTSNPCAEFLSVDFSACNLASLNLMRFRRDDGSFDVDRFRSACRILIIAQEILVDRSSYPTRKISEGAHANRQLGLGYANLGGLLMSLGIPYDSDEGRAVAASITAIMGAEAYLTSALLAAEMGPFDGYAANKDEMFSVIKKHVDSTKAIPYLRDKFADDLRYQANLAWIGAIADGFESGYRNSQATLLAPTGTIAFMMDCSTTGVEPDIALVKYKKLAGGGTLRIVNQLVPLALKTLDYTDDEIESIVAHIDSRDTIELAPWLLDEHVPVFDCAFPSRPGGRSIHWRGHIKMMAAVQPFLSGAISKTCNISKDSTPADVRGIYMEAWRLGLKSVAVFRDGSKWSQPLNTSAEDKKAQPTESPRPARERLPDTRAARTHKFAVGGVEGYATAGLYDDGRPGELFVTMAKEGSTVGGLVDTIGTLVSMCLQYGVPLEALVSKFEHQRFEPSGFTRNADIPIAKSLVDYIFRWLGMEFLPGYREANSPHREDGPREPATAPDAPDAAPQADGPPCGTCHTLTVRCGACYRCPNCGSTTGCG